MVRARNKKKSTGIFLLGTAAVLILFSFVSTNTNLFKGQLSLNPGTADVVLEVSNCGSVCTNPNLIFTTNQDLGKSELIVKNISEQKVVYAEYIQELPAGSRYEVAFSNQVCSDYQFDSATNTYLESVENTDCNPGLYEFIVSGATTSASTPLYIESATFNLSE